MDQMYLHYHSHSIEPAGFNHEGAYLCLYVSVQFGQMGYFNMNFLNCNLISSHFFFAEFMEYDYDRLKNKIKIVSNAKLVQ